MKRNSICLLIAFLFLFTSLLSFAQTISTTVHKEESIITLAGIIKDAESKEPVAYVSIGILNKPVGTVSNAEGQYKLAIPSDLVNETLQLSLVGYHTKKIPLTELRNGTDLNQVIYLTKSNLNLGEVIISAKKLRQKTEGRKAEGGFLTTTFNQNKQDITAKLGTEIGMKFESNKYPAFLKDFNWYFSANNFDRIKFRLNIYSLKNNLPDSLLLNKEIYTEISDSKTGWNKIDLEPYNLTVNSDFVIALQWVEHEFTAKENPKIWIPAALSLSPAMYFRNASQDQWKKFNGNISYNVTLLY